MMCQSEAFETNHTVSVATGKLGEIPHVDGDCFASIWPRLGPAGESAESALQACQGSAQKGMTSLERTAEVYSGGAYVYDGDGTLVKSVVGERVTYYVSTVYHRQETGRGSEVIKYYRLGSQQVAVRRSDGVQDVLEWVLSDH
jgi:hypothetical protein